MWSGYGIAMESSDETAVEMPAHQALSKVVDLIRDLLTRTPVALGGDFDEMKVGPKEPA
jgi:hypothetical protein